MSKLNPVLQNTRTDYHIGTLSKETVHENPFQQFEIWMDEALVADPMHANAMVLSTVDKNLMPDSRVMLLRNISHGGFTFFTNYNSKKGRDLAINSKAAMLFFWTALERQVRIEGEIQMLSALECDDYFQSRPFESRVGAWASQQSEVVQTRSEFEKVYEEQLKKYSNGGVPRPSHWGGYVLVPTKIEFWQGRPNRLHDRIRYRLDKLTNSWLIERLMP
jgi:pyridoxamine 5'-phosphate oxidase